jgi:BMFP domain-containing protein YqiC
MDPYTRQLLNEAIALDDKARLDHEVWEAKRAERAQVQARSHLVYKVYEPKVAAQPQGTTSMVEAADKAWVQAQLETLASVIGAEVGASQTEIVKKLREELANLRADIESLRQQKAASKDLSGVVSLHRRAS